MAKTQLNHQNIVPGTKQNMYNNIYIYSTKKNTSFQTFSREKDYIHV